MQNTCPSCYSCGMPFKTEEDHAFGDPKQAYCSHCVDDLGNLKSYEEILSGTAGWLIDSQGLHETAAIQMAKEILEKQPAWKGRV